AAAPPPAAAASAVADAAAQAASEAQREPDLQPAVADAAPAEEARDNPVRADPKQAEDMAQAAPPDVPPAAEAAASDAAASAFEWPPSTRLQYTLSGWYRGEVYGQAEVQWRRDGERYQVLLEVSVGPSFAPLLSRRMISDGELTADGLRPRRYDEVTQVGLGAPRQRTLRLDTDPVQLADGRTAPAMAGMQDTASQFVQLTWLFTLQPERLRAGQVVEFPLALPRRLERWRYEVVGDDRVDTPVGGVAAVHVRPTRETPSRSGRDLHAEVWIAPTLQYLPVRIHIRQDAETYVDLLLSGLPQQAAR
ncbi:DUF3108 domain-containing protein, partial [Azohydromonas sediminis]|uniref:DUF3108 domain-containing protein n=1 Tax=Azohydromonas sediminis TaxID=2259674 RepID=UPI0013C356BC